MNLCQHLADGIRQRGDLPHAVSHGVYARLRQAEAVKHDFGNMTRRSLQILGIGRKNGAAVCGNGVSHGEYGPVFLLAVQPGQLAACGLCLLQKLQCCHTSALLPRNLVPMDLPSSSA